jgi:hypothetical protein
MTADKPPAPPDRCGAQRATPGTTSHACLGIMRLTPITATTEWAAIAFCWRCTACGRLAWDVPYPNLRAVA